MPLGLMEDAVDDLLAYLEANIDTFITKVNAQYNHEPLDIASPQYFSEVLDEQLPPLPGLFISGVSSALGAIDDASMLETWANIQIVIADTHPVQGTLRRMLYRHILALVYALRAGERAGFFQYAWNDPVAEYGSVWLNEDNEVLFADAHINLRLLRSEVE